MEFNDIVKLAKAVAKADRSKPIAYSFGDKNYGYAEMNEALRAEFAALAPDYRTYKTNQNTIFALIEAVVDEVLPLKAIEKYGDFAEIKTFNQGDKPIFTQKISSSSKNRAKQFIGKVGLAGIYEVFKLEKSTFEISTTAVGGAAQIGFEDFLDGRVDFADILEIVMDGIDQCIYTEIGKQLIGAVGNIQPANLSTQTTFNEKEMDRLLAIADSYGGRGVIYCTFEFAATMIPSDARWASNEMKNTLWSNGYIGNYKNHQVVVLPQAFEDETNRKKVLDPAYAWIFSTNGEKPVKVALEGDTIIDEYANYDRSKEIQAYKKMGVGVIFSNDVCVYQNTSLTR